MMHVGEAAVLIGWADAEGATTPETLRQQDRVEMGLWKAGDLNF
ncbi:hypothetical protein MACH01_32580 [Thalassospira tepidiphila]|nr:hypothetical protein TH47_02290 [Thalassospira sp. MCCC 1A02803]BDW90491.1 hypothetical protein MACH01_32580 [Thalassospira tepidiphila]